MKFKTILFFLLTFVSNFVFGQAKYGFKVGINFADQYKKINPPGYPEEKLETKMLTGFQIGAFLKHNINDKLSLGTEVNFSLHGSKTKYGRTDFIVNPDGTISGATTGYYNDKIYQIEIPIFIQYNINQFYLGLGPTIGIKNNSKIDNYQNNDFKSTYYNSIDFGANSILGYSISKKLELNLRYSYGLINIDNRDYSNIKNRTLSISVLYSLN